MGSRLGTWTILAMATALAATAIACATGNTLGGGGDDDDGSGGSTTSSTSDASTAASGGGSTTSATTGASTTTSASTTASTSTGMMCTEDPCKLVDPQCGCGVGEACTVDATGTRSCVPEGPAVWGTECSAGEDCEAGSLCILKKDTAPTVSMCSKFCDSDAQCQAPGGLCVFTLNDGSGGTVPGVTLCSDNCDPITNTGCGVSGTSCFLGQEASGQQRFFTYCYGAGSSTQGALCPNGTECAATYGCFNTGVSDQCLKWCNVNAPSCPGATSCQTLTDANGASIVIGNITYGACL